MADTRTQGISLNTLILRSLRSASEERTQRRCVKDDAHGGAGVKATSELCISKE